MIHMSEQVISQSAVFESRDHAFYSLQSCCLVVYVVLLTSGVEFSTDVHSKKHLWKSKNKLFGFDERTAKKSLLAPPFP